MRPSISNDTNLHPISHRFQVITDCWSDQICAFDMPWGSTCLTHLFKGNQ